MTSNLNDQSRYSVLNDFLIEENSCQLNNQIKDEGKQNEVHNQYEFTLNRRNENQLDLEEEKDED